MYGVVALLVLRRPIRIIDILALIPHAKHCITLQDGSLCPRLESLKCHKQGMLRLPDAQPACKARIADQSPRKQPRCRKIVDQEMAANGGDLGDLGVQVTGVQMLQSDDSASLPEVIEEL